MRPKYVVLSLSVLLSLVMAAVEKPAAAAAGHHAPPGRVSAKARLAAIRRARVFAPVDIPSMDLRAGPRGKDARRRVVAGRL